MKDDLLTCMLPIECDVAYLDPIQIDAYGGPEEAKRILGVNYLALPTVFYERADLCEFPGVGHA